MALYGMRITVSWEPRDGTKQGDGWWGMHEIRRGVAAVSRKHALDKALRIAEALPCYRDRDAAGGWRLEAAAEILDVPRA